MVIATQPSKKQEKQERQLTEEEIHQMINSGGKTTPSKNELDTNSIPKKGQNNTKNLDEIKFTMRIPKEIIERVDKLRSKRAAKLSRNNWILDVIEKALEEAEKGCL